MNIKLRQDKYLIEPFADPERFGGTGVLTPLENYKNIGFLSNTYPDPLKITKLPIQHSMLGHHWPASETPFKWRLARGPLMEKKKSKLDLLYLRM